MIEKTVIDYLNTLLSVDAVAEVPADAPGEFVVIEKTGGGQVDYIKSATIAVQSYAASLYRAAEINELVKDAMGSIVELPEIYSVKFNSDYNFTDTSAKRYRYQAVFDLTY